MPDAVLHWSGGKDAALCLHRVRKAKNTRVACLLTVASRRYTRSSQHGVRMRLMERQAACLDVPLDTVWLPEPVSMATYDECVRERLTTIRDRGVYTSLYGDIFLESVRAHREERLADVGMQGRFPLWNEPTEALARSFIDLGFRALVVSVNADALGRAFVGRRFDHAFLDALPPSVDPCGENGEFHTFVYDGPPFAKPLDVEPGEVVYRTFDADATDDASCPLDDGGEGGRGAWFCDVRPAGDRTTSRS